MKRSQQTHQVTKRDFSQDRPKQVSYAVYLFYISIGWTFLIQLFLEPPWAPVANEGEFYTSMISSCGGIILAALVAAVLGRAIMRGSNWARILTIAWILLGSGFTLLNPRAWLDYFATQPVQGVLLWLGPIMRLISIVLLLLPVSSEWFRSVKAKKQASQ